MPTSSERPPGGRCPWCWGPIESTWVHCPACGVLLTDPDLRRLASLDEELAGLERRCAQVASARQSLVYRLRHRLPSLAVGVTPPPPPAPAPPPPAPAQPPGASRPEWTPARLGVALLGLGVALVALAALTFAAVAWPDLGDPARAGVLLTATGLVAGLTVTLRHRLPATSQALGVLSLGLLLVDWYVLWVAGWGAVLPATGWWALGTALVAGVAVGAGVGLDHVVARVLAPLLAWTSVLLAIAAFEPQAWSAAVALAAVVTAAVPLLRELGRRAGWHGATVLAAVVAGGVWGAALVAALAAVEASGATGVLVAAVAVGAPAGAPVAVRVWVEQAVSSSELDSWLGAAGAMAVGGAGLVGASGVLDAPPLLAAAGLWGAAAVACGRVLPGRWSAGLLGAGATFVSVAAVPATWCAAMVAVASLVELAPWSDDLGRAVPDAGAVLPDPGTAWLGATVAVGVAVGLAALATRLPGPGRARPLPSTAAAVLVGCGAAAGSVVVPALVGLSVAGALVGWAVVVVGAGLAAVGLRRPPVVAGAAVLVGGVTVPAIGWLATNRWTSVAALAGVVGASGLGAVVGPRRWRPGLAATATAAALAEVVVVGAALEAPGVVVGPALVLVAGTALVAAAWWDRAGRPGRTAVAVVAGVAGAVALPIAASDADHGELGVAVGLTLGAVAVGLAGGAPVLMARVRAWARWGAAVLAVGAWWAWMAQADVEVVEAYTLPAAGVVLVAGLLQRRASPGAGSWSAYGPALVLGLGPSLAMALGDDSWVRPVLVLAAGAGAVAVGVGTRLQAPLVAGAVVLLVEAVDTLAPVVALVPRWLLILAVGMVCVWAGATFERRVRDLRRGGDALRRLH